MKTVRVLIVYDSKTGNVEAMAHAVEEGAEEAGALVDLKRVEDVDIKTFSSYDAYAFGSPTHCGTMSVKMNDFINNKMHPKYWGKLKYKVAVAFTSSGGLGGGNETVLWALISTILNFGMMTFGIPDYVSKSVTLHYGAVAIKKPNKSSLNACRVLGRLLVEYAKVVKAGLKAK